MATQFKSTDSDKWAYQYGRAIDGSYFSSGNTTWNPTRAGCSGTSGSKSMTVDSTAMSNNQLVFIHQSRGTGVGNWELNRIVSGGGTTSLTLEKNLKSTYTDSGASQAQIVRIYEYNTFTLQGAHTITNSAWNGNTGGMMIVMVRETCSIQGIINGDFLGYRGAPATGIHVNANQGEGSAGAGSTSTASNGSGGGGAQHGSDPNHSGGGGGGAYGANATTGHNDGGAPGTGGSSVGVANLTTIFFGAGGGAGAVDFNHTIGGGKGGNGGSIVIFIAKNFDSSSGTITIDGQAGENRTGGAGADEGAGGGAAGGAFLLKCMTATLGTGRIGALAGSGGAATNGYGGAGSVGRIQVDYGLSLSGTTSPTLNSTLDRSLIPSSAGLSLFM